MSDVDLSKYRSSTATEDNENVSTQVRTDVDLSSYNRRPVDQEVDETPSVAEQTTAAFGDLAGYDTAEEFADEGEANLDQMMNAYLATGDDYYSRADLLAMSADERFKILKEEQDRKRADSMVDEYVDNTKDDRDLTSYQSEYHRKIYGDRGPKKPLEEEYLRSLKPQRLTDILYEQDRDLVTRHTSDSREARDKTFTLKSVPRAIAPYVRVVGKGAGFVVVKPMQNIESVMMEGVSSGLSKEEQKQRELKQEEVIKEIDESGAGGSLIPREATSREKAETAIANMLVATGVAGSNYTARSMAKDVVGDVNSDNFLENIGLADLTPAGAYFALDEAADEIANLNKQDAETSDYLIPSAIAGLSILEAIPLTKGVAKVAKGGLKSLRTKPSKTVDEIIDETEAARKSKETKDKAAAAEGKFNIGEAKARTAEKASEQAKAARVAAAENQDVMDEIIDSYEKVEKVEVHSVVDGKKVIDYEKARDVGISRMRDLELPDDTIDDLGLGPQGYRSPILNPDKLDAVVATIGDIRKIMPDAFKGEGTGIDRLFKASVENNLFASDELAEILEKYGLGLNEFIRVTVGAGSVYGKGLQKYGQMVRAMDEAMTPAAKAEKEIQEVIKSSEGSVIRRVANIQRGLMVSAFATAARNFEGFLVRAPIEGLTNVFENAIHSAIVGKKITGNTPVKGNPFKKAFRMYGHMAGDPRAMGQYTDFILDRPEYKDLMTRFYDQIAEIQTATGRGASRDKQVQRIVKEAAEKAKKDGTKFNYKEAVRKAEAEAGPKTSGTKREVASKVTDDTLTAVEDFVSFLNTPNRMQEHHARRTIFLDKLSQLTDREWGMDLIPAINQGKIKDIVNDAASVRPKDARSFSELATEAAEKALDATYANQPRMEVFQDALRFLNRIPGSPFILPFPRFMFKSMEYMYETTLGLPTAMTRKIYGLAKGTDSGRFATEQGALTYNAEMAARGMAGWTAMGTTYMAAEAGFIDDQNRIVVGGKAVDVTAQFPLGQLVYLGKMMEKIMSSEKDFGDWFDGRQFVKLFSGTNFRQGHGLGDLMDDVFLMASDTAKIGTTDQLAKAAGKFAGNIATRFGQPYQMVIDAERVLGIRDTTIRDFSSDPYLDDFFGSVGKGFYEGTASRGFISPDEEAQADVKQFATKEGGKQRKYAGYKLLLGLNITEADTPQQEFLLKHGFREWDFRGKTGVGTVDNAINETMSSMVPLMADTFMRHEERLIARGKSKDFVRAYMRNAIDKSIKGMKSTIMNRGRLKTRGADDPQKVKMLFNIRRYNLPAQRLAVEMWEELNPGKTINFDNKEHLVAIEKSLRANARRTKFFK